MNELYFKTLHDGTNEQHDFGWFAGWFYEHC